eukprot:TRINITY_DN4022_c0_g1_i2.p1 TRINITY_DN4022_c0_g1~~TRINITY_DN4022_c0_g1_i2.p1  ORF type:complete len:111 (-),score=37.97 TRINITY_DN4022_c0_g1_i2:89-421(-)
MTTTTPTPSAQSTSTSPSGSLSIEEKRKLLWGNKKKDTRTTNSFCGSFTDAEKQTKFMKLMGLKEEEIPLTQNTSTGLTEKSDQINAELEKHYRLGVAYHKLSDGKRGLS